MMLTFFSNNLCLHILGHCIIQVLPEISCEGLTKDDIPDLLERVQNIMQNEFDSLNRETAPTTKVTTKRD